MWSRRGLLDLRGTMETGKRDYEGATMEYRVGRSEDVYGVTRIRCKTGKVGFTSHTKTGS